MMHDSVNVVYLLRIAAASAGVMADTEAREHKIGSIRLACSGNCSKNFEGPCKHSVSVVLSIAWEGMKS
jgi:hypothetical protein